LLSAALLERWPQVCRVKITKKMFKELPTNRFVPTTKNSMKCVVNWIPLRIRIRSRNYQPHLKNEKQLEQELELSFFDAGLAADKIGDSPTKFEMKLGPQTHSVPSPNLKGPHNWSQNCRKMAIIIPRRRRGTWEGVLVANWCSK